MRSFADTLEGTILSSIASALMVGGIERIGLFDYEKNQEIINLIMQYLNCDGSNGPIAQPNGLAGG